MATSGQIRRAAAEVQKNVDDIQKRLDDVIRCCNQLRGSTFVIEQQVQTLYGLVVDTERLEQRKP